MAERESLPYITYPLSTTHISNRQHVSRVSAHENASREERVAPGTASPHRLNVRSHAKCGRGFGAYLKKLAKEAFVSQSREKVRIVLDGEEVDNNGRGGRV